MRGALVAVLGLAWCGATLAADRIRIEIDGVDRPSPTTSARISRSRRYTQRDDLTDRRCAGSPTAPSTKRPMRCGRSATTSPTSAAARRVTTRTGSCACSSRPANRCGSHVVDIVITGRVRDDTTLRSVIHNSSVKPGAAARAPALREPQARAAAQRAGARLPRREARRGASSSSTREAQTADVHIALATGGRYQFGRDPDRAERDQRPAAAGYRALRRGRARIRRSSSATRSSRSRTATTSRPSR